MKKLDQNGSHLVVALLGVLVVASVGYVGFRVAHNMDSTLGAPTTATNSTSSTSSTAPSTITNRAELSQAAKSLDTDNTSIDSSVDGNTLNSSLNSML